MDKSYRLCITVVFAILLVMSGATVAGAVRGNERTGNACTSSNFFRPVQRNIDGVERQASWGTMDPSQIDGIIGEEWNGSAVVGDVVSFNRGTTLGQLRAKNDGDELFMALEINDGKKVTMWMYRIMVDLDQNGRADMIRFGGMGNLENLAVSEEGMELSVPLCLDQQEPGTGIDISFVLIVKTDSSRRGVELAAFPDQVGFRPTMTTILFADEPPEEPPSEEPPAEDPPSEEPPEDEKPSEEPPSEEPPAEDPPSEEPPEDEKPSEDPPSEEPPEDPPSEEPPEEEKPSEDPPTEDPPDPVKK